MMSFHVQSEIYYVKYEPSATPHVNRNLCGMETIMMMIKLNHLGCSN